MSGAMVEMPAALRERRGLGPGESFCFACRPDRPCFNTCCADVNIILTPLDVLGLSRRLGMTTTAFLAAHTVRLETKELQLPVVALRMSDADGKPCPFVGPVGCTVYDDRPWACRMYPVGMALPPARAGEEPQPLFFLFEDEFCDGRQDGAAWTVEQWRGDQGVVEREELEKGFRALVSHPWFIGGRRLDDKRTEMFFTGCYDLDRFRTFVLESSFLDRFTLDAELIRALKSDDHELLQLAFRWLRFALFGEPTLTVRPHQPSPRRRS
jgi:uncharacterized protein